MVGLSIVKENRENTTGVVFEFICTDGVPEAGKHTYRGWGSR